MKAKDWQTAAKLIRERQYIQTPNDDSDDNEDNKPDNTAGKRQRKIYATVNTIRKEMTKQRCADVLKKQQEEEKAKTQA